VKQLAILMISTNLLIGLVGCGGAGEQACLDFLAAYRAGGDRCDAAYKQFVEQRLEFANCEGAAVRDEDVLRAECLPFLESASCPELKAGPIPAGCQDQVTLVCPEELRGTPRCEVSVD
jgi:hypothetical protein